PVLHENSAAAPDRADKGVGAGKNPTVQNPVLLATGKNLRHAVQLYDIGRLAFFKPSGRFKRLGPARQGHFEKRSARGRTLLPGGDVARLSREALAIFQRAQFLNHRKTKIGVRADSILAAISQKFGKGEKAISQIGLADGTKPDDRSACGKP